MTAPELSEPCCWTLRFSSAVRPSTSPSPHKDLRLTYALQVILQATFSVSTLLCA